MCRFLVAKSEQTIFPKDILDRFAKAVKNSPAPDGDWQGDGWGIAWLDENNVWKVKKSLQPIWEDLDLFVNFPKTKSFAVHARSATFSSQKGILEFNEPFTDREYAFVFNGFLRGVSLSNIPGKIGSEKIWNILKDQLNSYSPQIALERTKKLLLDNSKEIIALNIGLVSKNSSNWINYYTRYTEYYSLKEQRINGVHIVCSEEIG